MGFRNAKRSPPIKELSIECHHAEDPMPRLAENPPLICEP